nr:immunoglobulin light chain junction region [Macaca mulatta]MOW40764.1 immunoglobulin light chain junction region [Macaca mulatta]MOW44081.1 immunoglobulin light chain junction region [Macaca mulatta]
CQQYNTDPRTF